MPNNLHHDIAHIRRAAALMMASDDVHELRALEVPQPNGGTRTMGGFFDNPDALADAAAGIQGAKGIYLTLNRCRRELLPRAPNRLRILGTGDATGDVDVLSRRWLLIDCDPVRPKHCSSTVVELAASVERCREIGSWLRKLGWPELVLGMSGNGGHQLGLVELPADDGGLIKAFLDAISHRFSDSAVKVDTAVFNAARITKLFGTVTAKGDHTAERPHRRAELLSVPDDLRLVQREQIELAIAQGAANGKSQSPPPRAANAPKAEPNFQAARDRWLSEHRHEYPTTIGACPACQHQGCFHGLPDEPSRWICFSSDHGVDSGECGVAGRDGRWTGDQLDLAAHERGVSPTALLRECGYLGVQSPTKPTPGTVIVDSPRTPDVARAFAKEAQLTVRYAGDYYSLGAGGSTPMSDEDLDRHLWQFLERARHVHRDRGEGKDEVNETLKRIDANSSRVNDCKNALIATVPLVRQQPCWLDARTSPRPADLVQVGNGLLHLPDRMLMPPDGAFFTASRIETRYVADCPQPGNWLRFLHDVFPEDAAAIELLQEWFGYVISGRTDLQKILLLIGAIRCGKGTIARVLRALLGIANVAGPSLSTLYRDFALGALLHKTLAIFPDARISGRPENNAVVLERLLSISGEDTVDVDRKFKPVVSVHLPVRFMILSNELPAIPDASGALANRFMMLTFSESFLGREDPSLAAKLTTKTELEGILRWSLEGLERLVARGAFVQPKSGQDEATELLDLTSPAGQFADECCEWAPTGEETTDDLFNAWRWWCEKQNLRPGVKSVFVRDFRNAARLKRIMLKPHSPRTEPGSGKRNPTLQGVRILPAVREQVAKVRAAKDDRLGEEPPF